MREVKKKQCQNRKRISKKKWIIIQENCDMAIIWVVHILIISLYIWLENHWGKKILRGNEEFECSQKREDSLCSAVSDCRKPVQRIVFVPWLRRSRHNNCHILNADIITREKETSTRFGIFRPRWGAIFHYFIFFFFSSFVHLLIQVCLKTFSCLLRIALIRPAFVLLLLYRRMRKKTACK